MILGRPLRITTDGMLSNSDATVGFYCLWFPLSAGTREELRKWLQMKIDLWRGS